MFPLQHDSAELFPILQRIEELCQGGWAEGIIPHYEEVYRSS
jgi:hypothetical protein